MPPHSVPMRLSAEQFVGKLLPLFLQKTVFQGNESPLVSVVVLVAMKSRLEK